MIGSRISGKQDTTTDLGSNGFSVGSTKNLLLPKSVVVFAMKGILMNTIRAAVVQDAPVAFNTIATVDKVANLVAQAAGQGAQLVVFPEAFIAGYPKGVDFGARVGMRLPEGRQEFQRYWESAIDVPGPVTYTLGELARTHQLHLVIGVIEREGGTLYCTVLFFGDDGRLLGKHRKVMPTAMDAPISSGTTRLRSATRSGSRTTAWRRCTASIDPSTRSGRRSPSPMSTATAARMSCSAARGMEGPTSPSGGLTEARSCKVS